MREPRRGDYDSYTLKGNVQDMVAVLLPEALRIHNQPDLHGEAPKPEEMASFIMRYPQYVTEHYRTAAWVMADDRSASEELPVNYQRLAGSLIRVMLSDQELHEIAGQPYLSPAQRFAEAIEATPEELAADQALIARVLNQGE